MAYFVYIFQRNTITSDNIVRQTINLIIIRKLVVVVVVVVVDFVVLHRQEISLQQPDVWMGGHVPRWYTYVR